jgi:hypothetical protein
VRLGEKGLVEPAISDRMSSSQRDAIAQHGIRNAADIFAKPRAERSLQNGKTAAYVDGSLTGESRAKKVLDCL